MENPFERLEKKLTSIEEMLFFHLNKEKEHHNDWMDIDGLIEYMPYKMSKQTVYGKVSKKEIPFHKKGKFLYFSRDEIDTWLRGVDVDFMVDEILSRKGKK